MMPGCVHSHEIRENTFFVSVPGMSGKVGNDETRA